MKRDDFEVGRENGWNRVLVADFLLQHSLDANAVPSKATDRQWGREPRIKNLFSVLFSEGKVVHSCLASVSYDTFCDEIVDVTFMG